LLAILDKIKRLEKSVIAKNTSVVLGGQFFSRLLQILYVAALARYIGTEGIGKISIATALNGLTVLLVAPGITTLLVSDVAKNRLLASSYLMNTLFIRVLLGLPFIVLTVITGFIVGYQRDTLYIIFVYAFVYLFDVFGQIFTSVFQAFESMEYDALAQIVRDVINVSLSLLCIYLKSPLIIIVIVSAIAQICKFILAMAITHRRLDIPLRLVVELNTCKELLVKSLPFGALIILFTVRFQLGVFILSLFDTASAVGIYSAATNLILMILMLPGAFSSALLPAYSRIYQHDKDNLSRLYQLSYKYLALAGFPLGLVVILFGGEIIGLVYGTGFEGASMPVIILACSLFAMMGYSNGPLLNAIGKQSFFAWTQALLVLADAFLCLMFIPYWGPVGAAVANVLSSVGGLIIHSIMCHHQLGLPLPWMTTMKTILATLMAGSVILMFNEFGISWWVILLVIMPFIYAISIFILKLVKVDELRFLASGTPAANRAL
jgi:O-antigen/teichoic acid export membrane protein